MLLSGYEKDGFTLVCHGGVSLNGDLNMKKINSLFLFSLLFSSFSAVLLAYDHYAHSKDGSTVACGEEYTHYQHSRDGSDVCAGGKYTYYQHSRDGTDVACGGEYTYYQHSRNGASVCIGGKYKGGPVYSRDRTDVAVGWHSD